MKQTICEHCDRAYKEPDDNCFVLKATGKNGILYKLSVVPLTTFEDDAWLCPDCVTYLMGRV